MRIRPPDRDRTLLARVAAGRLVLDRRCGGNRDPLVPAGHDVEEVQVAVHDVGAGPGRQLAARAQGPLDKPRRRGHRPAQPRQLAQPPAHERVPVGQLRGSPPVQPPVQPCHDPGGLVGVPVLHQLPVQPLQQQEAPARVRAQQLDRTASAPQRERGDLADVVGLDMAELARPADAVGVQHRVDPSRDAGQRLTVGRQVPAPEGVLDEAREAVLPRLPGHRAGTQAAATGVRNSRPPR